MMRTADGVVEAIPGTRDRDGGCGGVGISRYGVVAGSRGFKDLLRPAVLMQLDFSS